MFEGINWLAVGVCSFSTLFVGAIWYNVLFKNVWMEETGITEAEMKKNAKPALFFGGSLVMAFVAATFIAVFVKDCELTGLKAFGFGALDGAVIALTTVGAAFATNCIYERKSLRYLLMSVVFWVICFALMGGVLNVWKG